jgi:Sulfotransferase family
MPITRIGDRIVYFAHAPKCGGSSVEAYLTSRFGPLAFRDGQFNKLKGRETPPWNRSSPQHIPVEWLDRLFPPGFFDASFALVRDPAARLLSAYLYQRDNQLQVSASMPFGRWLRRLEPVLAQHPFRWDNHFQPMHRLIPADAVVFRLENGMAPVVDWLDGIAGNTDGPRDIAVLKKRSDYKTRRTVAAPDVVMTRAHLALIARIYAGDYDRFGYEPRLPVSA